MALRLPAIDNISITVCPAQRLMGKWAVRHMIGIVYALKGKRNFGDGQSLRPKEFPDSKLQDSLDRGEISFMQGLGGFDLVSAGTRSVDGVAGLGWLSWVAEGGEGLSGGGRGERVERAEEVRR